MSAPRQFHNLVLIGFMGTGKSSVGHILAHQLRHELIDTDHCIEARAGKGISQIFAELGDPAFREMERQLVAELADSRQKIIATGGGLGANAEHLASLKEHALVVCLWATPEGIWRRVNHQGHRPLLQGPDALGKIRALLAERAPVYRQADVLVNTELRSMREVAMQVLHHFHSARQKLAPREDPSAPARG